MNRRRRKAGQKPGCGRAWPSRSLCSPCGPHGQPRSCTNRSPAVRRRGDVRRGQDVLDGRASAMAFAASETGLSVIDRSPGPSGETIGARSNASYAGTVPSVGALPRRARLHSRELDQPCDEWYYQLNGRAHGPLSAGSYAALSCRRITSDSNAQAAAS
jgi:hypothetical protein